MKFFLITLISSSLTSVTGQLFTFDESAVAPIPAPEMVVFYVNERVTSTACTAQELLYIDSKMLPDMDMTLIANNFETPEWEVTADLSMRKLSGVSPNCDFCRRLYPRNLCNAMYNCSLRRHLRKSQALSRELNTVALSSDLLLDCQTNIMTLSRSRYLSQSCKFAIGAAVCHVEFV